MTPKAQPVRSPVPSVKRPCRARTARSAGVLGIGPGPPARGAGGVPGVRPGPRPRWVGGSRGAGQEAVARAAGSKVATAMRQAGGDQGARVTGNAEGDHDGGPTPAPATVPMLQPGRGIWAGMDRPSSRSTAAAPARSSPTSQAAVAEAEQPTVRPPPFGMPFRAPACSPPADHDHALRPPPHDIKTTVRLFPQPADDQARTGTSRRRTRPPRRAGPGPRDSRGRPSAPAREPGNPGRPSSRR